MSSSVEDNLSDKIVVATGAASLDKYRFACGLGMQKQWIESSCIFLDFVGSRHRQSIKVSLETGELVVTEVDAKHLKKFETKAEETTYLVGLKH